MIKLNYTIVLKSDAEIATGFGSSLLDAIAPRNLKGNFVIPASHVKGLLRQSLLDAMELLPEQARAACNKMLGSAGESADVGGLLALTEAVSDKKESVVISRTSINEYGTAKKGSLRTTEAVPVGTEFRGSITADVPEKSGYEYLLKFALLSIMELGGSRSRGCGACLVKIEGENRKPGDLLLESLNANYDLPTAASDIAVKGDPQKQVLVRLELKTNSPICVPELPVVGNNTICSGWSIPASAVQGILLTRINAVNSGVATACFNSPLFRTWPLQPVPEGDGFKGCVPVRASASHKISKLADANKKFNFCDEILEEYEWKKAPANAPIKSADGVLIKTATEVVLWRSGDMARYLSAHGVINGDAKEGGSRRNLFTVQSVAETNFVGFASMPEDAYNLIKASLEKNNSVLVGKARNVRGNGTLSISEPLQSFPLNLPKSEKSSCELPAFIVQSPVLLPADTDRNLSAAKMLEKVVEAAGWGKVKECSATVQIMFGWNRNRQGREHAELVIAPGSVFLLESIPENWKDLLLKGLGEGRDRGYGAVLPHPGIAENRYRREEETLCKVESSGNYAKVAWALWGKSKRKLSASQISRLLTLLDSSKDAALKFLNTQKFDRSVKFWDSWQDVFDEVVGLIEKDSQKAKKVFKVWYDLTVATTGEGK